MSSGYPVSIKIPTELDIDWFETVLQPLSPQVTDDLTDLFSNLGKACPIKTKAVKLIDIMPEHQAESPLEMGT